MCFKPPHCKCLQGGADARRRACRRPFVLQVPDNKADAVPCERLLFFDDLRKTARRFEGPADEPGQDDADGTAQNDPTVSETVEDDRVDYIRPAAVARRPVQFKGPEEGNRCIREHGIGNDMRENQQSGLPVADLRDFQPVPTGIIRQKAAEKGKQQAVRRAAVKGVAVPPEKQADQNVDVRQIGQKDNEHEALPAAESRSAGA